MIEDTGLRGKASHPRPGSGWLALPRWLWPPRQAPETGKLWFLYFYHSVLYLFNTFLILFILFIISLQFFKRFVKKYKKLKGNSTKYKTNIKTYSKV